MVGLQCRSNFHFQEGRGRHLRIVDNMIDVVAQRLVDHCENHFEFLRFRVARGNELRNISV